MLGSIVKNIKNIPGWRTRRKLLVIESDDWGSTRMPNKEVYNRLIDNGIRVDENNFTRLDSLASTENLRNLMRVLKSVKDKNGNHAAFTPFVNVTNPDFAKIIADDYKNYYFETFDHTLTKVYGKEIIDLWKEGIKQNIFVPEYHGREHYNFPLLMKFLQEDAYRIREAFKEGVVHVPVGDGLIRNIGGLAPTYYYDSKEQLEMLGTSLIDGLKIFENILGYEATVFVPPNGIFNKTLEKFIADTSIKAIIVDRKRREPDGAGNINTKSYAFQFGSVNENQQIYYSRNCKFEPVQNGYSRKECLSNIEAAFKWGKPAVLSTHRINFVSALDEENSKRNLSEFEALLKLVSTKWPDVEFVTSAELVDIIKDS